MTAAMDHLPIRPLLVDHPLQKMRQDRGRTHAQQQVIGLSTRTGPVTSHGAQGNGPDFGQNKRAGKIDPPCPAPFSSVARVSPDRGRRQRSTRAPMTKPASTSVVQCGKTGARLLKTTEPTRPTKWLKARKQSA
jgi:hypothetical protein